MKMLFFAIVGLVFSFSLNADIARLQELALKINEECTTPEAAKTQKCQDWAEEVNEIQKKLGG